MPTKTPRGGASLHPPPLAGPQYPPQKHAHTSCPQVAFFNSALASAEEEQARLRGQLKEEKLRCQRLAHLAAPAQDGAEKEVPASGTRGDSVPAETHQALQVAMDKLQVSGSPPVGSRKGGGLRSDRCRALTCCCGFRAVSQRSCRRKWI